MKLANDIANGARRFLVLLPGGQAKLTHGIGNASLHRLQAVADLRQRAIQNDVHRIVEVGLLGIFLQRLSFDAFQIKLILH